MDESCFLDEKRALRSLTCSSTCQADLSVGLLRVEQRDVPAPGPPKTKITVTSFLSNALSSFFSPVLVTVTGAISFTVVCELSFPSEKDFLSSLE